MNRLVFVHGSWQMLLVASALKQGATTAGREASDYLVLYPLHDGPLPSTLLEVISRIAGVVRPWKEVIVLDQAIKPDERRPRPAIEALRARLGVDSVDEIWVDSLIGPLRKVAVEAYPSSAIVLYEDGLHTYLSEEDFHLSLAGSLRHPRDAYRKFKVHLKSWLRSSDLAVAPLLPRHLARVKASYLWISQMVSIPTYQVRLPWVQLETRYFRETVEQVSPLLDGVEIERSSEPRAMVLGECFSNYGDLTWQTEFDCFLDQIRRLRALGYEVVWKEHPRIRRPFHNELSLAVPELVTLPDLGPWPIELFIDRLGIAACTSLTSTILFTLPLLFGLPSYSSVHQHLHLLRFPNDELARIVMKSIPNLDALVPPERSTGAGSAHRGASHSLNVAPAYASPG
jgi:hypothetical protein